MPTPTRLTRQSRSARAYAPHRGEPMADYSLEQFPGGWDEAARFYDQHVASFTAKFARDAMDLVGVTEGLRVIDVAAGSGALAMAAAQRGAEVLATDFSQGMAELLRE